MFSRIVSGVFFGALLFPVVALSAATQPTSKRVKTEKPPPAGDIYIVSLTRTTKGYQVGKPVNITNRPKGYDNQPHFDRSGKFLLYTSIRKDKQADLYQYNLTTRKTKRLTQTKESEFSPTVSPDPRFLSTVRVEKDKTQRLWKFPRTGGPMQLVLSKVKRVGYHAWVTSTMLGLFLVGEGKQPHTLVLTDTSSQKTTLVAKHIGRCLQKIPNHTALSFVDKTHKAKWLIRRLDGPTGAVKTLTVTLPGQEDYTWTSQGHLIMGKGKTLYRWIPNTKAGWSAFATISTSSFQNIRRLSISPSGNHIAFVGQ